MVWPVLVVTVEVVMLALFELLTLTALFAVPSAALALAALLVAAGWQAVAASAAKAGAAARSSFVRCTRRMKVISSLQRQSRLRESVCRGSLSGRRIAQNRRQTAGADGRKQGQE